LILLYFVNLRDHVALCRAYDWLESIDLTISEAETSRATFDVAKSLP